MRTLLYSYLMTELHAIVRGRVQMVMFRDFTARRARSLGFVGEVRNLSDGSVSVIAQGEKAALEKLVARLHRGSLLSRVDSVDVTWHEPTRQFNGFDIAF